MIFVLWALCCFLFSLKVPHRPSFCVLVAVPTVSIWEGLNAFCSSPCSHSPDTLGPPVEVDRLASACSVSSFNWYLGSSLHSFLCHCHLMTLTWKEGLLRDPAGVKSGHELLCFIKTLDNMKHSGKLFLCFLQTCKKKHRKKIIQVLYYPEATTNIISLVSFLAHSVFTPKPRTVGFCLLHFPRTLLPKVGVYQRQPSWDALGSISSSVSKTLPLQLFTLFCIISFSPLLNHPHQSVKLT